MHKVERLEVPHPARDLRPDVQEAAQPERPRAGRAGRRAAAVRGGRQVSPEELVQVAVLQVLHGDEVGPLVAAHGEHAGDVGVLQHGEKANLADEVGPETDGQIASKT